MIDARTLHLPVAHAEAIPHGGFPSQDDLVQRWVSGHEVSRSFEGPDDLSTRCRGSKGVRSLCESFADAFHLGDSIRALEPEQSGNVGGDHGAERPGGPA